MSSRQMDYIQMKIFYSAYSTLSAALVIAAKVYSKVIYQHSMPLVLLFAMTSQNLHLNQAMVPKETLENTFRSNYHPLVFLTENARVYFVLIGLATIIFRDGVGSYVIDLSHFCQDCDYHSTGCPIKDLDSANLQSAKVAMSDFHFIIIITVVIFFSFFLQIRELMNHFFEYLLIDYHYCASRHFIDQSCLEGEFYVVISLVQDFSCQISKCQELASLLDLSLGCHPGYYQTYQAMMKILNEASSRREFACHGFLKNHPASSHPSPGFIVLNQLLYPCFHRKRWLNHHRRPRLFSISKDRCHLLSDPTLS